MKVKVITGATYMDSQKIYKPVGGVIIVKQGASASEFANEVIELKRVNSKTGNTDHVYPKCKVLDVAEISAQGEGFYRQSATKSVCLLTFSDSAVNLDNDRYLELELINLAASHTYEVYGLENNGAVDKVYCFNKMTIAAGESVKKYTVGDNELLALPVTGIANLKQWTNDGATIEYLPAELSALMDQENDIIRVNQSTDASLVARFGFENWYLISVADVKEFEIETTGVSIVFYLIDNK